MWRRVGFAGRQRTLTAMTLTRTWKADSDRKVAGWLWPWVPLSRDSAECRRQYLLQRPDSELRAQWPRASSAWAVECSDPPRPWPIHWHWWYCRRNWQYLWLLVQADSDLRASWPRASSAWVQRPATPGPDSSHWLLYRTPSLSIIILWSATRVTVTGLRGR